VGAVAADHAGGVDFVDGGEVDVDVGFLYGSAGKEEVESVVLEQGKGMGWEDGYVLHVWIARRDTSAANTPAGGEALEEAFVFDEFGHTGLQRNLALRLGFGALEKATPEAVDLVLDALGVLNDLVRVAVARLLLVRIGVVGAEVVGDLNEPYGCADEDVHVPYVWLHCWNGLDRGCPGADDGDTVVLPCLCLVV
jgi:hypothetical protein